MRTPVPTATPFKSHRFVIPLEAHHITMSEEADEDEGTGKRRGPKTIRDVQKSQLDKLMANPV